MSGVKKNKILFLHILLVTMFGLAVSCNSKTHNDESEIVVTPATVAVRNFSLQANDSVMAHLDSVFFAIDLNTGVIFNADSLPKGTDVSRLIANITFANNMTKAELSFTKNNKDTVVNYLTNPTDSIDFSNPVKLEVTAEDGTNSYVYTIKVNVHDAEPGLMVWRNLSFASLPARLPDPRAQKTVIYNDITYCFIEENNYTYTLATSSDLNDGEWAKTIFNPGFTPDIDSFTPAEGGFYIMDVNGNLFCSEDLDQWDETGEIWITMIGAYSDGILGIKSEGGKLMHTRYPASEGYEPSPVAHNFPLLNFSKLGIIESKWTPEPIAILAGGMTPEGISSDVWAYDGTTWAVINQNVLPALEKPMLARYVTYRETPQLFKERELDVWLIIGGYSEDGKMNREVFLSYDNGVNWITAPEGMQLPEEVPLLGGADIIVADYYLQADLADAWKPVYTKSRGSYTIDGTEISWLCPYLYIFGGYSPYPDNILNTAIYRGVLQKLEFTPDI